MRATINGVVLEGTPQEIVAYDQLTRAENLKKVTSVTVNYPSGTATMKNFVEELEKQVSKGYFIK